LTKESEVIYGMEIQKKDSRFRIVWQGFSTDWIPDTPSNRKAMLVFLRSLRDSRGKHVFTFQELSVLFDSNNRQASSQHMEDFRDCGCDFLQYLTRKRKVDGVVVEAVKQELIGGPLEKLVELRDRVNARLGRNDLTSANMRVALEQIPYQQIRDVILSQLAQGKAHYQEEYLLTQMMESNSVFGERAGIQVSESTSSKGMSISDPTSIRNLVTPDIPTSSLKDSLKWVVYCMTLYYYGVPLSVLGSWLKVHKTTVLRWMMGLSIELFPMVYRWIYESVKANIVYIDEKWLKIQGKWYYWFVVLDSDTGIPVLASLLGTKSRWACRWIGVKLKQIGKIPKWVITDGLAGYSSMVEYLKAKHILCHFHHQQRVTLWLKKHFQDKDEIAARKSKMRKVFQTQDKRTVRRRLGKLKESSQELGISEWTQQTEANLPRLLPSVGSKRIPRTSNAISCATR
jgi:transposase-like protein